MRKAIDIIEERINTSPGEGVFMSKELQDKADKIVRELQDDLQSVSNELRRLRQISLHDGLETR